MKATALLADQKEALDAVHNCLKVEPFFYTCGGAR
jgi:hypothetical protein